MIHPSYVEMIEEINKGQDPEEAPLVTSRYSVVLATAKRARQIIDGDAPRVKDTYDNGKPKKPLSIAVDELYSGKVTILPREENEENS
ncbi:MAG: DNA-directed RNA polymerase subunit omega [Eubacteriales bacterium]|jgi:DNA-directed RNA polymerase subunit omega